MRHLLIALLAFSANSCAAPVSIELQGALNELYEARFTAARQSLVLYSTAHPLDPLPHALQAAGYLFAELEQGGALKSNLLSESKTLQRGENYRPDKALLADMRAAIDHGITS